MGLTARSDHAKARRAEFAPPAGGAAASAAEGVGRRRPGTADASTQQHQPFLRREESTRELPCPTASCSRRDHGSRGSGEFTPPIALACGFLPAQEWSIEGRNGGRCRCRSDAVLLRALRGTPIGASRHFPREGGSKPEEVLAMILFPVFAQSGADGSEVPRQVRSWGRSDAVLLGALKGPPIGASRPHSLKRPLEGGSKPEGAPAMILSLHSPNPAQTGARFRIECGTTDGSEVRRRVGRGGGERGSASSAERRIGGAAGAIPPKARLG